MTRNMTITAGIIVALTLAFAAPASAQGFGISFSKHGKHGGFGIGIFANERCGTHVHTSCCVATTAGHWEDRCERVWVDGCAKRVWVRPVYRTVRSGCGYRRVMVRAGYWRTVRGRGHYETVTRRVWVPGTRYYTCGH